MSAPDGRGRTPRSEQPGVARRRVGNPSTAPSSAGPRLLQARVARAVAGCSANVGKDSIPNAPTVSGFSGEIPNDSEGPVRCKPVLGGDSTVPQLVRFMSTRPKRCWRRYEKVLAGLDVASIF